MGENKSAAEKGCLEGGLARPTRLFSENEGGPMSDIKFPDVSFRFSGGGDGKAQGLRKGLSVSLTQSKTSICLTAVAT
jgi:hypothetical protein